MRRNPRCFPGPLRSCMRRPPSEKMHEAQGKAIQVKGKERKRWQRVMPIHLVREEARRMPQGQLSDSSETLEFHVGKKKSLMKQFRATMRKLFPFYQRARKKAKLHGEDGSPKPVVSKTTSVPPKYHAFPRAIRALPSPKVFPTLKRKKLLRNASIQLDVNIVEEHAQSMHGTNTVVQARRMMRRISVVSLPPGIRKVDNLLDNISEKSIQLLALRSAELQQCESLGDRILQSSKQFQRVSLRTTKKHKWKNTCFPCKCCC
uniref:Chromosome 3 open reading frame 49 n=1 Tax=Podarcis muralis TaxID=64176 RepID=A0A670JA43_PODMU